MFSYFCRSADMSIFPSAGLFMSVRLFVCLSACRSDGLLSLNVSVFHFLSLSLCVSVRITVYRVYLSYCLSVKLIKIEVHFSLS